MAERATGRTAAAILRTDLVATLHRAEKPVATGIHLEILANIDARALLDKIALGCDHRVITDIEARQRPEDRLRPLHRAVTAAVLFTGGTQDHIAAAVQLQVSGIESRAGQVNIAVQRAELQVITRLKQAATVVQGDVFRHADLQVITGADRPRIGEPLYLGQADILRRNQCPVST